MTKVKFVGQFDVGGDSFFSGVSSKESLDYTGVKEEYYHLGEPIEEILNDLSDLLRLGKVELEFIQSEEAVLEAKNYYDEVG